MNSKVYEFDVIIQKVDDRDGAYIEFPYDIRQELKKGRVKVNAAFNAIIYQGRLVRKKMSEHIIGLHKDIRARIHKQLGDCVHVAIQERT